MQSANAAAGSSKALAGGQAQAGELSVEEKKQQELERQMEADLSDLDLSDDEINTLVEKGALKDTSKKVTKKVKQEILKARKNK